MPTHILQTLSILLCTFSCVSECAPIHENAHSSILDAITHCEIIWHDYYVYTSIFYWFFSAHIFPIHPVSPLSPSLLFVLGTPD